VNLAGRIWIAWLWSTAGSGLPVSWATSRSIAAVSCSASAVWPWVSSQRGLSGRVRRTYRMTSASAGPTRKPSRQPSTGPIQFNNANEARVPMIDPAQ
jgi:hypothetical protein